MPWILRLGCGRLGGVEESGGARYRQCKWSEIGDLAIVISPTVVCDGEYKRFRFDNGR